MPRGVIMNEFLETLSLVSQDDEDETADDDEEFLDEDDEDEATEENPDEV